jgi:hypothetical protein
LDCSPYDDCQLDAVELHRCRLLFVLERDIERGMGEVVVAEGRPSVVPKLDIYPLLIWR